MSAAGRAVTIERVRDALHRRRYTALEKLFPVLRPLQAAHPRRWPRASVTARGRSQWAPDVPVRFVTSFSDRLYEESARRGVASFRRENPSVALHAYVEAADDVALGAMVEELEELGVVCHRLASSSQLHVFQSELADVIPPEYGGTAPDEVFAARPGDERGYWRRNMIRWARKVTAIEAASREFRGILVWLDSDTRATAPVSRTDLSRWFGGTNVFYLKASRTFTETGVIGFDLTRPGTRQLVEAMSDFYLQRKFLAGSNWSDCIAFDYARSLPGMPPARDIAFWADREGHVVQYSPLSACIVHEKGNHRRGGFYSSAAT